MAYLPYKVSHASVTSSVSLFIAENVDVIIKHGSYEQFYLQQHLSENVHFQIYSRLRLFHRFDFPI